MKRKFVLKTTLLCLTTLLSSCALFDILKDLTYSSLDEFFKKNNFIESTSQEVFNKKMIEHTRKWEKREKTYTNSVNVDIDYYSPCGDVLTVYVKEGTKRLYSRFSENFYFYGQDSSTLLSYSFEDEDKIFVDKNLVFTYQPAGTDTLYPIDDAHKDIVKIQEFEQFSKRNFILSTNKGSLFFFDYLIEEFFFNTENDINNFTFYQTATTVPISCIDFANEAIALLPERKDFVLPIPSDYTQNIYHRDYLEEETRRFVAHEVILPYVDILDYVELVKASGLEIYKGEHHPLFDPDRSRGGEYVFYDQNHEFVIHLEYENPIAVVFGDSNYGVKMMVQRAKNKFSYYGLTTNTQVGWNEEEKTKMLNEFGYVLPFINLGRKYHLTDKRNNGEHPLTSALDMDVECWWIFDDFYKDVVTPNYGQLLEEEGFSLYQYPTDSDAYKVWYDSEDVKYYECYLRDDLDIAIKFLFDDIYGNTIKIFKKSELLSWHNMAKED